MGLINYVAARLFYCASIFMFMHTFLDYIKKENFTSVSFEAKVTWRRCFTYVLLGILLLIAAQNMGLLAVTWYSIVIMCIVFSVFQGTFSEKLCIFVLAQSFWSVLKLLNDIIFGDVLYLLMKTNRGKTVALDLINMLFVSFSIVLLRKESILDVDMVKKRGFSLHHQVPMIALAIQGDIIICIASFILRNHLDIIVNSRLVSLALCIGSLCMVCFALSIDNTLSRDDYELVNKTLKEQINSQFAYYKKLEQVTKETRAMKHDMKNHLIVLKGLATKQETEELSNYIDNLQSSLENVSKIVSTGNSIVDSIVNEKLDMANKKGIQLNLDVHLRNEIDISSIDLCIMLANSLDNAIEACSKIKDGNTKDIKVYGRMERGFLSFIIKNTVAKNVYIMNNRIVTDKLDKLNHGYGLQNINNSVKRNGGKMKIECEDDFFTIFIDVPCRMNTEN